MNTRPLSPRHARPRNRGRQTAARELAAAEGLTYQQALARLSEPAVSWWSVQLKLTLHYAEIASGDALTRLCAHANQLLGERGQLRAIDCEHSVAEESILTSAAEHLFRERTTGGICVLSLCLPDTADAESARGCANELVSELAAELATPGPFGEAASDLALILGVGHLGLQPKQHFNTDVTYFYRDEGNWKSHFRVILTGEPTPAMMDVLRLALKDGFYLIPEQVGLPDLREDDLWDRPEEEGDDVETFTGDDPWHELEARLGAGINLTTATEEFGGDWSFIEFVAAFASVRWDDGSGETAAAALPLPEQLLIGLFRDCAAREDALIDDSSFARRAETLVSGLDSYHRQAKAYADGSALVTIYLASADCISDPAWDAKYATAHAVLLGEDRADQGATKVIFELPVEGEPLVRVR